MKKLLLASVALSGLAFAAPAHADIDLELGGFFKGYGAFVNQDETAGQETAGFDILRSTELHFGGETTLDNGLTVGVHAEIEIDGADNSATNESYVYFSGNWGRVNVGVEDGAGYLLQVAAPSADSNIDGLRQYIQPFAATGNVPNQNTARLDYDMINVAGVNDKITYLSPIMSGVQLGLSYTPDSENAADDREGVNVETNTAGDHNETYEIGLRYEGQVQNVGVIAGAGYSVATEEGSSATTDDRTLWNLGLDLDIGPFGVGVAYVEDDNGLNGTAEAETETYVIGVDYTTGPFKLGATYYNQDNSGLTGTDYERYTAGVTYEYGPGMSFRGSLQQLDAKNAVGTVDADGTALLLGTNITF